MMCSRVIPVLFLLAAAGCVGTYEGPEAECQQLEHVHGDFELSLHYAAGFGRVFGGFSEDPSATRGPVVLARGACTLQELSSCPYPSCDEAPQWLDSGELELVSESMAAVVSPDEQAYYLSSWLEPPLPGEQVEVSLSGSEWVGVFDLSTEAVQSWPEEYEMVSAPLRGQDLMLTWEPSEARGQDLVVFQMEGAEDLWLECIAHDEEGEIVVPARLLRQLDQYHAGVLRRTSQACSERPEGWARLSVSASHTVYVEYPTEPIEPQ